MNPEQLPFVLYKDQVIRHCSQEKAAPVYWYNEELTCTMDIKTLMSPGLGVDPIGDFCVLDHSDYCFVAEDGQESSDIWSLLPGGQSIWHLSEYYCDPERMTVVLEFLPDIPELCKAAEELAEHLEQREGCDLDDLPPCITDVFLPHRCGEDFFTNEVTELYRQFRRQITVSGDDYSILFSRGDESGDRVHFMRRPNYEMLSFLEMETECKVTKTIYNTNTPRKMTVIDYVC